MVDYNDPNMPWRNTGYDPYKGMTDEERWTAGCLQGVLFFVMTLVVVLLCALFSGCTTTKYVTVPEVHTDTVWQNHTKLDSIYVHDSIMVSQWQQGDTVYLTRDRWHTQYVTRERTDTVYKSRTDSVSVPYPVEVKVPAELTTWQKLRMNIGTFMIFATLLFAVGWLLKRKLLP